MAKKSQKLEDMNRRKLIKTVGSAGLGAVLAGCSGGGTEDGSTGGSSDGTPTESAGMTATESESEDTAMSGAPSLGEVVISHGRTPSQTDPHHHSLRHTSDALINVYEGLMMLDTSREPAQLVPKLATDWELVDDTTFVLDIREGVQFHNGDTLGVEDVVFSIRRMADPDIDGATQYQGDYDAILEEVNGDEEDRTVTMHLTQRDSLIAQVVASASKIMNKAWVEERSREETAAQANGTGPYQVDRMQDGIEMSLTRFDDWWGNDVIGDWVGEPHTDIEHPIPERLTFSGSSEASTRANQVIAGDSHLVTNLNPADFDRVDSSEGARMKQFTIDRTQYIAMNDLYEPFDSQEFRQAMNYAIDSEAIVEEVLNGRGTAEGQPAPPSWPGYNPDVDPYPHDPEEATRLVEESGYTGEMELELKAAFGRVSKGRETALAVANQITESVPNVTCTVNEMSEAALDDIKRGSGPEDQEGRGDFFMNNTGGSPAHAARGKVNSYIYSGGHSNTFSDSEIDELFEEAVSAPRDELDEIGHEMMELVHEKAPWLFLFIRGGAWGINNEIDLAPSANESMEPYEIHPYDGN